MVWNSLKKQLYSTSYTTVEHQNYVIKTKNVRYDVENAKLYLEKSIKLSPYNFQAHRNLSSLVNYKDNNKWGLPKGHRTKDETYAKCARRETYEETGWHEHEFDYVITILTDCKMLLENPDGSNTSAEFIAGDVYERKQGVCHNVINASDQPMSFIELELKK